MGDTGFKSFFSRIVWQDQFVHGFSYGQIWYLIVALMLGSGAIANDNRANALLVYLSKPCTKLDYLIGKWMGIYIPMLAVMLFPSLIFYGFGLMSYRDEGFFSKDPLLIFRILMLMPIAAAFETSLILAVSSLFRQGQIAGASYAALYFITYLFTLMMAFAWAITQFDNGAGLAKKWISYLYYCSIDGVQIGLGKSLLHSTGSPPFGIPGQGQHPVPPPSLAVVLLVVVLSSVLSVLVAWKRVHAVEVVR
jgi:ABC-2 type transport system permease protein